MKYQVSVIIPVYNAEKYLRQAVESAVHLEEVGEIILVEDKSPDNALALCMKLEDEYSKIKLIQHPNQENRGAGASRNLGIVNSTCDYIAFLDADDWYLPNRFQKSKAVFQTDLTVDGVYEPVGTFFYEDNLPFMGKVRSREEGNRMTTYFKKVIPPDELFYEMLTMRYGTFHTNGIVLKRELFKRTGFFNESLRLHQDIELWVRCAYYGKLVGVNDPSPVAIRAVHPSNRTHSIDFKSKSKYYTTLYTFFKDKDISAKARQVLERKYLSYYPGRLFHDSGLLKSVEKAFLFVLLKLRILPERSVSSTQTGN
jgi:glycosyltransferase involved in cell wall biosynthesis